VGFPAKKELDMTQHKDRKAKIRARMAQTGEPYAEAARQLDGAGQARLASPPGWRSARPGERLVLVIVCDMAYDLMMASLGPLYEQDADGELDTIQAQQTLSEAAYKAWASAARRIGAEWGYRVETYPAPGDVPPEGVIPTTTPYGDGCAADEEGRTVEGDLWQAAHDAFEVKPQAGTWIVAETMISASTDRPQGSTGVRWTDTNWTECFAVIDATQNGVLGGGYEKASPGEFVFDAALSGEDDCACDRHLEMRRERQS
jgi:hypothetical protein